MEHFLLFIVLLSSVTFLSVATTNQVKVGKHSFQTSKSLESSKK